MSALLYMYNGTALCTLHVCMLVNNQLITQHSPSQEEEELIRDWQPDPLVPDIYPKDRTVLTSPIVSG